MKDLYIIRHAKSSWSDPGQDDFDRPLNKRGKRNAPEMGQRLQGKGIRFDLMISSHAKRAYTTACMIAAEVGYEKDDILVDPQLYLASNKEIQAVVRQIDKQYQSVALVAHNNGITDLANSFSSRPISNVPTCGILAMRFEMDEWSYLDETFMTSFDFDYPKNTNHLAHT